MRATLPFVTFMFRMNIRTCKSTDESGYKASFTCLAGMNTEAYDTETVPYRKQQCAESEQPTFHTNMQSYKNHSNCKIAFCLKSNHKNLTESIKKPASSSDAGHITMLNLSHIENVIISVVLLVNCIDIEFLTMSAVKIFQVNLMETLLEINLSGLLAEAMRAIVIHNKVTINPKSSTVIRTDNELIHGCFRNSNPALELIAEVIICLCSCDVE